MVPGEDEQEAAPLGARGDGGDDASSESRLLSLPGGLQDSNADRIRNQTLWGSLWPGPNRSPYVCICEQGRRDSKHWEGKWLKTALYSLLKPPDSDCSEYRPTIQIVDLAWVSIEEHLERCDVFYMCGGEPPLFADLFRTYQRTMGVLESRIRGGKLLYIGSCGGACMMSSCYAGVRTMQVIPGMISVWASEDQITIAPKDQPSSVTMTNQTGLMLHGEEVQAFVVTKSGVYKYHHLVQMLEKQVRKCFGAPQLPMSPMVPSPPPPANADQLPRPDGTITATATASEVYVVQTLRVDGNLIKLYIPSGGIDTKKKIAVLYLGSTVGEEAPLRNFQGSETVIAPQFTNHGRYPWKNGVPDWLVKWVSEIQVKDASCQWSLFGFSRGAAWGALLAADARLQFHRVLLVAPYVLPSRSHEDECKLKARLPMYKGNLLIAFGSADPWPPFSLIQEIIKTSRHRVFDGAGHEASLAKAVQECWPGLFY